MHPDEFDPNATTQNGSLDSQPRTSPPVWKLRLLYVGGQGIVKPDGVAWHGDRPLGIGRRTSSPAQDAWLQVNDERVSREHARLHKQTSGIFIEDLRSRNGSARNGVRLRPADPQPVRDGDVIRIGDSFVLLRYEPEENPDVPMASIIGVSKAACALRFSICRCALIRRA